jgi:hypothetical protein
VADSWPTSLGPRRSAVGGSANDFLVAKPETTTLRGGGGDDYFYGGPGADVFDGGDGFDRISFSSIYATGACRGPPHGTAASDAGAARILHVASRRSAAAPAIADTLHWRRPRQPHPGRRRRQPPMDGAGTTASSSRTRPPRSMRRRRRHHRHLHPPAPGDTTPTASCEWLTTSAGVHVASRRSASWTTASARPGAPQRRERRRLRRRRPATRRRGSQRAHRYAGDDTLAGGDGADTLDGVRGKRCGPGGAGADTAVFSGPRSAYVIMPAGASITVTGPDGPTP